MSPNKLSKCFYVSNRLPFNLQETPEDKNHIVRSSGGLVTALLGVKNQNPTYWVGTTTDERILNIPKEKIKENFPFENIISILLPKALHDSYYNDFCNDVIWPLFHYEGQRVKFTREAWKDYIEVNRIVAEEMSKLLSDGDVVWIHDFHFFLVAQFLRQYNKNIKIGFFLHIPFPSSEIFRQLPIRREILEGLLHCDLIGFHDYSYLRHFSVSLWNIMSIETDLLNVTYKKQRIKLGVFPVSIETDRLQKISSEDSAQNRVKELENIYQNKIILGIDRLDYSKGLELKLGAFESLLRNHPECIGNVSLLQVAVPTRVGVQEYMQLKNQIDQMVGEINGKFGTVEYVPVRYIYNSITEEELIALYRMSDVLFVASKRDGMNLVALEYVACQNVEDPGVVLLSEFTGASSILSEAIRVNPWDLESTANSMMEALKIPQAIRVIKHKTVLNFLENYTSQDWAQSFLNNLMALHFIKRVTRNLSFEEDESLDVIQEKIKDRPVALFLDFDGTLAPIHEDPAKVTLSETIKDLIHKITEKPNFRVVIISGRNKAYLSEEFKGMDVDLVSEHGANYYNHVSGKWRSLIYSDVKSWIEPAKTIMNDYAKRVPLSFLEKKEASLVWHYRRSPPQFANYQAKKLADELDIGLSNLPAKISMGKKNVEVRAFEANKGDFISWYLDSHNVENFFPVAIGDDVTDEDMFKTLRRIGLTVKVGPEDTQAEFAINDQTEIVELLNLFSKL